MRIRLGYFAKPRRRPRSLSPPIPAPFSAFNDAYSYTTNAYHVGVDFRLFPRTTISYDQFLNYFKQDNMITDNPAVSPQNFGFVLGNPIRHRHSQRHSGGLGKHLEHTNPGPDSPCATPIVAGTPNTATPACNGFLSYSRSADRGISCPRSGCASNRIISRNLRRPDPSAIARSDNKILGPLRNPERLYDSVCATWTTTGGPSKPKRVSVNADWSGVYSMNEKLRIDDFFRYDNWRIPASGTRSRHRFRSCRTGVGSGVVKGLLLPIGVFNSTNCRWR